MERDPLRDELERQRERIHQLASDVVAVRLDQAGIKAQVHALELTAEKYVPIIDRLDDAEIVRRAEARRAAREASIVVGAVSILGVLVNVLTSLLTHGIHL